MAEQHECTLTTFYDTLQKQGTPPFLIKMICHGITWWLSQSDRPVQAPTEEQLGSSAAILTMAFIKQHHSIGWFHLFLGGLSKKWRQVYQLLIPTSPFPEAGQHWGVMFISNLWQVMQLIWASSNALLYGIMAEASARLLLQSVHQAG